MHLAFLPDRRAELDPHGPAVAGESDSLTNAELLRRVRAAARHLEDLGIGPGIVVALKLTNGVEFIVLLFAAWRLGATVTPVNPALTEREVVRQLDDSGARLLVVEGRAASVGRASALSVRHLYREVAEYAPTPKEDPGSLALLTYTGGQNGVPKGEMLSHANLDSMTSKSLGALEIGPLDTCLSTLPLFHANSIVARILTPLLAGASIVIAGELDPHTLVEIIERERPTFLSVELAIDGRHGALSGEAQADASPVRFGNLWGSARLGRPADEGRPAAGWPRSVRVFDGCTSLVSAGSGTVRAKAG